MSGQCPGVVAALRKRLDAGADCNSSSAAHACLTSSHAGRSPSAALPRRRGDVVERGGDARGRGRVLGLLLQRVRHHDLVGRHRTSLLAAVYDCATGCRANRNILAKVSQKVKPWIHPGPKIPTYHFIWRLGSDRESATDRRFCLF
jgi:hypothetical protein